MNVFVEICFGVLLIVVIVGTVKMIKNDLALAKKRERLADLEIEYYECVPKYLKAIVSFHGCTYAKCQICNITDCKTGKVAREQGDVAYYEFLANMARSEDAEY